MLTPAPTPLQSEPLMMPELAPLLQLPEGIGPPMALFFMGCAAVTAMLTAALGAGGGAALLIILAQWVPPAALIPVHGLTQMGANLSRATMTWRHIQWPVIAAFLPGAVLGAWAGNQVLVQTPETVWHLTIAAFVLWFCWGPGLPRIAFGRIGIALAAAVTTFASLFVGATGPLVAAFLKQLGENRFRTVATFAAAMSIQHLPKAVAFASVGFILHDWLLLIVLMISATVVGNRVGLRFLRGWSDRRFHQLFSVMLTLLALRLIWQALNG